MFSITVPLNDTLVDPIYEHVHHGRCFFLLEQGRLALLKEIGMPNELLMERGEVLVITRVEASYLREVRGAHVTVTCDQALIDGREFVIYQRIMNERNKVAVSARIVSVFMDINSRRGITPPEDFVNAYRAMSIFKAM
jgi:acyl-CoA thioesterase FadM